MPYVKLDHEFPDHPKVVEAGPLASWLYVCGLTYAARLMTDGYIPYAQVRRLADVDDPYTLAEKLVEVGLWEAIDGGYLIHDYCEHQTTRADIEKKRAAGKAGGKAAAQARAVAPAQAPATANGQHPLNESSSQVRSKKQEVRTKKKPKTDAAAKPPPDPEKPFGVFVQFMELLGTDPASVDEKFKGAQLGAAKNMLGRGFSAADILGCAAYMHAETWRTSPFDLTDVQVQIGKWAASGKPEQPRSRASPRGDVIDEEFLDALYPEFRSETVNGDN